jgi:photosystem II stability/assembly factor-like uncharacterized protein
MKASLSAAVFCGLFFAIESVSAQTWTQTSAPTNEDWLVVASSADGSRLAALAARNQIWISTNSGTSWISNTMSLRSDGGWYSGEVPPYFLASSADGLELVAGVRPNPYYVPPLIAGSTNFGGWTLLALNSASVASSVDGTELVEAGYPGTVGISTNSGLTWTALSAAPLAAFPGYPVAMSADGRKLVVAASLIIYTSPDSGNTWITNNVPAKYWRCIASSANGNTLAAVVGGPIYTSTDSGNTWTSTNAPNENWTSVAMSADGSKIVAVSSGNGIYTSTDSGNTWTSNNAPNLEWNSVASSADGNKLVAAAYNFGGGFGGIWTLQATPTPQLNVALSVTNLVFSWIVPSTNFVLQQNLDLTTTNWTTLTNTPTLTLSNLNDEVVLSPSNSRGFFRLMAQ